MGYLGVLVVLTTHCSENCLVRLKSGPKGARLERTDLYALLSFKSAEISKQELNTSKSRPIFIDHK
jgi:hypothetical protein